MIINFYNYDNSYRLGISDFLVDFSAKLEMTIDRIASDYSSGSYLLYLRFDV